MHLYQSIFTTVSLIGLNPALYKGHSFGIGAATQAAQQGFSPRTAYKKWGGGIRMLSENIYDCRVLLFKRNDNKYIKSIQ